MDNVKDALQRAAALKKAGEYQGARDLFKSAADLGSIRGAVDYAVLAADIDLSSAIQTLQAATPQQPLEELEIARTLLLFTERAKRIERGLHPLFSIDTSDFGFKFATDELQRWRSAIKALPSLDLDSFCLYFQEGGRDRNVYGMVKKHVTGTVDFDIEVQKAGQDGPLRTPAIWLACDETYLAFANPLIASLKAFGPVDVVLEVMEPHELKSNYYGAYRFVRLAEWMAANNRPVWLMDVDAIANRSPAELFPLLDGHDVAFRGRPGRIEPWNQINASVVGFNNTAAGKTYLQTISWYIKRALERGNIAWGVDQVAMLCCVGACRPKINFLKPHHADYDYTESGIIWINGGPNKWHHLQPGAKDPDRQRFVDAFQKWMT